MQASKSIIITCAGLGSRLGLNIPKCLLDFDGKPLIVRHLEMLKGISNIYIVVGYQAHLVIETVRKIRDDVIFILNHEYLTTGNTHSLYCGSWFLNEYIVSLDGDLVIDKDDFFKLYNSNEEIIACTRPRTKDCVYCSVEEKNGMKFVTKFTKDPTAYEWSGLFQMHNRKIKNNHYFIYQALEEHLPLKMIQVNSMDIDTPEDYELATSLYNK